MRGENTGRRPEWDIGEWNGKIRHISTDTGNLFTGGVNNQEMTTTRPHRVAAKGSLVEQGVDTVLIHAFVIRTMQ